MPLSRLASHTRTTMANVGQIVSRMERAGLVTRTESDHDRRVTIARMTAYGRHQFWLLVRRLRRVEAAYRTTSEPTPRTSHDRRLDHRLRPIAGAPPRLVPDLPPPWRRYRERLRQRARAVASRAP
ncbi:MarR family winged helix-turn-helix transcriptional regulator [Demequina sp. NBRC 110053]|uniref:MarR family winged helix-turn-helix transcriptional regulator n=1 Tax=Demequina sp. NBRC 110053 TaxID=1570342 RepID=UPI0009FF497A|nr:MarR family transcriptional regulator [Demequina sp. NBRC 110053]